MKLTLTPIVPKKKQFKTALYKAEIEKARREVKEGILRDFKSTFQTWKHKPKFGATRKGDAYYISTKDEIYGYVEGGTKPHIIRAKGPRFPLHFFRGGFRSKTRPGNIPAGAGRAATRGETFAQVVHHPGTKPRSFSKMIKAKWQKIWITRMQQAIRLASRG
jgi:hypothetical protein